MFKKYFLSIISLSLIAMSGYAYDDVTGEVDCIPTWAIRALYHSSQLGKLAFSPHLDPFAITGDFNRDGKSDIAVLVNEIKSGDIGIAIIHQRQNGIYILGAGNDFGNGGPNWDWMDEWKLVLSVEHGEGIYVAKSESASALIYWDGKKYVWEQWGD